MEKSADDLEFSAEGLSGNAIYHISRATFDPETIFIHIVLFNISGATFNPEARCHCRPRAI